MPEHTPPVARTGHRAADAPGAPSRPCDPGSLRSPLLSLSLLPAGLVAALGAAALVYLIVTTNVPVDGTTLVVLALIGIAGAAVLAGAAVRSRTVARSVVARVDAVRATATEGRADLQLLAERISRGEQVEPPSGAPDRRGGDAFDCLTQDLAEVLHVARAALADASARIPANDDGQQVEVFVNLARRLQSLVHREIQLLDDLENQVEDPDLLKGLFQVDHLATRIRRHAENLAVLGGAVSRRQWSRPVALTEVLRSAIAEVQHYSRVKLVPPVEGTLGGHAVADVIHLAAELIENATMFSPPHTQVLLRAQIVSAGVAVEVEDRGLGMPPADQERMNRLLADPSGIDLGELLRDGRIGLFVVSAIGRRHGIAVRLRSSIYGGVQAVFIVPHALLGAAAQGDDARPQQQVAARPAHEPGPTRPGYEQGGAHQGHEPGPAHRAHESAGPRPAHELGVARVAHEPGTTRRVRPENGYPTAPAGPAVPPAPAVSHAPAAPAQIAPQSPAPPPLSPAVAPLASAGQPPRWEDARAQASALDVTLPNGLQGAIPPVPASPQSSPLPSRQPSAPPQPGHGTGGPQGYAPEPRQAAPQRTGPGVGPGSPRADVRPQLPRRQRQANLAPQLQNLPGVPEHHSTAEHDPTLMASFMRGVNQGETRADHTDSSAHRH